MAAELVSYIVQHLVSEPDKLQVTVEREPRNLRIEIRCAADDAGRIIAVGDGLSIAFAPWLEQLLMVDKISKFNL